MSGALALVDEESAAWYAGRPGSTIRRWASEGRISRYSANGKRVRYNAHEIPKAERDEWTNELIAPAQAPPLPHNVQGV